jgi:hypothetical protein
MTTPNITIIGLPSKGVQPVACNMSLTEPPSHLVASVQQGKVKKPLASSKLAKYNCGLERAAGDLYCEEIGFACRHFNKFSCKRACLRAATPGFQAAIL